jgi:hypothetical protein
MSNEQVDLSQVKSFSVVKIPKEHFDFMKRNPKLTQLVGQALMEIHAAEQHIEEMRQVLNYSTDLRSEVENATPEEVEAFIKAAQKSASFGVMDFNDLPPGVAETVRQQFGEDQVITTDLGAKLG